MYQHHSISKKTHGVVYNVDILSCVSLTDALIASILFMIGQYSCVAIYSLNSSNEVTTKALIFK